MESTSLVKALAVLEATAADPAGRSLATLAAEVALPKPTIHRILKTLVTLGYLEHTSLGVYRQTPKVQRLVSNNQTGQLAAVADPVLRRLHGSTQETVNLGVLRGDQIVYLQVLESTQPLRRVATPSSVDPFHTTALGRAIVSHLPAVEQEALVRRAKLEKRTPHTNVDPASLTGILVQAKHDGYSLEVDETDVGVTCIGAPVLQNGVALGAISISVPTARASGEALSAIIEKVCGAAQDISRRLTTPAKKPTSGKSRRPQRTKSESRA